MSGALTPAPHRGPLLAAGGVVLAVAIALVNVRMSGVWGHGGFFVLDALAAAFLLGLGLRAEPEWREEPQARAGVTGTEPRAAVRRSRPYIGVLLLGGYLVGALALGRLAELLGADSAGSPGALAWVSAVLAAASGALWRGHAQPVFVLIAALAAGVAVLAFVRWVIHPRGAGDYRVALLLLILTFAALHARARERRRREGVLLVDAAGVTALALGALGAAPLIVVSLIGPLSAGSGGPNGPTGWALVPLVTGCLLVAFAAIEREPGPGFLGAATLAIFAGEAGVAGFTSASLLGWPLVLLVLAVVVLGAGLRPSRALPPEPGGPGGATVPLRGGEPSA